MATQKYTRCAKSSLKKFANQGKKDMLAQIHAEYTRIMQEIIDIEFSKNDHQFKTYISKQTENIIAEQTWLSKRMIQAAGKQAMAVLRGTATKQNKRKQHINWVINNMDLSNARHVICELLKDMRRGKNHGRIMSSWTYTAILTKLKQRCEEENVSISFILPTYTSRRCSKCGWTKDGNRNGEEFECDSCGNAINADLNSAINISSGIKPIKFNSRNHYDMTIIMI